MNLTFTLDENPTSLEVDQRHQVLDILRNRCHKKHLLSGCSPQGMCGSCVVLVNGKPRLSCTLRAKNIQGKNLQTTESVEADVRQSLTTSFVAFGATQCCYCLPGILQQTATLLSRFPQPNRQQIDRALQMHSCRCLGWVPIRRAIQNLANKDPLPSGTIHQAQIDAMWGKRPKVSDVSPPDLLFATPLFPEVAHGIFQRLVLPDELPDGVIILSWSDDLPNPFLKPGTEFHDATALAGMLLAQTEYLALGWKEHIRVEATPLPKPPRRTFIQESFQFGDPVDSQNLNTVTITVTEEARDPGYLETECVVAFPAHKRLFVNGQQPSVLRQRYPDWSIKAFATGGDFGGRDCDHLTEAIVEISLRLNRPVALRLSMTDSIRIRPKSPPGTIELTLSANDEGTLLSLNATIELDGGHSPALCRPLLQRLAAQVSGPYHIPYVTVQTVLFQDRVTRHQPLRDTGAVLRTVALERAMNKLAQQLHFDSYTLRRHNIQSPHWKKVLDSLAEPYVQALRAGKSTALSCATQRLGWSAGATAQARVCVEANDSIVVYGGHVETGQFHEWNSLYEVHLKTGIPIDCIHYECCSVPPVVSCSALAGLDRALGLQSVSVAARRLAEAMRTTPLKQLIGRSFTGEASLSSHQPQHGFAAALTILRPDGTEEEIVLSIDSGQVHNPVLFESLVIGSVYAGLGREGVVYQENGLPSPHYRALHLSKAKETPVIRVLQHPSQKALPWEMAMAATTASIANAHSTQQQEELIRLPFRKKRS